MHFHRNDEDNEEKLEAIMELAQYVTRIKKIEVGLMSVHTNELEPPAKDVKRHGESVISIVMLLIATTKGTCVLFKCVYHFFLNKYSY